MEFHQGPGSVPVCVTVSRVIHLRRDKNEPFVSFVRAEFNGTVLGDSEKLDVSKSESVDHSFTCGFECSEVGHTLDDLAHKPVILTVIKVLPKEKKTSTVGQAAVGQAAVDLLPLLRVNFSHGKFDLPAGSPSVTLGIFFTTCHNTPGQLGQCSFSSTMVLHPVPGSPTDISTQDGGSKPSLDVTVSVPEPLLSESQLSESNLLSVTVETAYSIPDVWNSGPPCSYVAALQVPLTAQKEQILLFSNGVLKSGGERELVPRPKKWPIGPLLAPDAQIIPETCIECELADLEDGDLTSVEDRKFRADAESHSSRVSWDTERRCFLDAGGATSLICRIAESRLCPLELMKSPQAGASKVPVRKAGKEKTQAEDETQIPFHGVAYVDLAPLLYPGVRRVRGAYRLHPFYDSDLLIKTKRNTSVLRESMKAAVVQGPSRSSSSVGSIRAAASRVLETHRTGRDNKEAPKKTGTQEKLDQNESITDAEQQANAEGQMYADSRSYIVIEIALDKPLVPKRPAEELAKRVMELIPPRPALPRHPAGAERAVRKYQAQITSVVSQVLDQYQQMFGAAFVPGAEPLDPSIQEQRKNQLFGELNCSGKYFAFKEQIKYSVVRIVREKMLRTEAFTDKEQLQAFLSQLYVLLVDEMHVALNKTLSVDAHEVLPQPPLDCFQLRHFAKEAQLNEDYQLAARYYQEQLARDRGSPSPWFDYGAFYMLRPDYIKAEECFKTAVSIDQAHVPSLLMCGILSEMNGRFGDAETFFERATCIQPSCVVSRTLLGMFYMAQENFIQAEMTFQEATKQLRAAEETEDDTRTRTEGGAGEALGIKVETEELRSQNSQVIEAEEDYKANADPGATVLRKNHSSTGPGTSIFMETVEFLLQNYALQMAQRALAQELVNPDGGLSSGYQLALARLALLRGESSRAEAALQEALRTGDQNQDVWALYGHLYYSMKDYKEAQKCYERTLDFVKDASDMHPVYLRLGSIYLQGGEYEKAKTTYLRACTNLPSGLTWLGLGTACYRLGELSEAEDALTEANTLNNENPQVWGYLSLVCLQTARELEAEQSYKYALKFHLRDEPLLQEITELQDRLGFGNPSFS